MNILTLLQDTWDTIRGREAVVGPPDLHDDPRVAELERDAARTRAVVRMLQSRAALHGGPWDDSPEGEPPC